MGGQEKRHASEFWQLTVNAREPALLAAFWAKALSYQVEPALEPRTTWNAHYRRRFGAEGSPDRIFDPQGLRPPLWFQHASETESGATRLHVDVYVTGRDDDMSVERRVEVVERRVTELVEAGAGVVRRERDDDPDDPMYYVVMRDPEGNEFCVS